MAEELILDFSEAPPAQGGARYDYVPPGTYILQVGKAVIGESQNGKPMITVPFAVAQGKSKGKRLGSFFTIPRVNTDDHKFPLQRLHALAVACGLKPLEKKVKSTVLTASIEGKRCVAEVEDRDMPGRDGRPPTTFSDIVAFYSAKSDEGKAILKDMQSGAKAETPAEAPTEELATEPEVAEETTAAEPEEKPEATDDLDELDSLFEE